MKVGLVLEGGAMRGMYTAGVLDTFLDNHICVDEIVGVSAGVLFGVNYLSNQRERSIRYNKKYANDKRYMGIGSLIKTGNIINNDFAFYEVPFKLDVFDEETYEKAATNFYAGITNVETGEAEYVKIQKPLDQMEVLKATSAMPFVSKIVELESGKYLDGGVTDSIPLDKCQSLGCDKVIVILTRPIEYRKKKSNKAIAKIMYRKYPKLVEAINNRYLKYNEIVEKIIELENNKEIFVIRPSRTVKVKRIERDANKLQEMYDLGISDSKSVLDDLKEYLNK